MGKGARKAATRPRISSEYTCLTTLTHLYGFWQVTALELAWLSDCFKVTLVALVVD